MPPLILSTAQAWTELVDKGTKTHYDSPPITAKMSRNIPPVNILFVCLGNICRSPLAEGVFRRLVDEAGLTDFFEIDSAGTGAWHAGEPPDERMREAAEARELDITMQRARQFIEDDLSYYDHILVMDKGNLRDALSLDAEDAYGNKVRLFREFDPSPGTYQVPDPYYGGENGFSNVYDIVERTARVLLERLIEEHDLPEQTSAT